MTNNHKPTLIMEMLNLDSPTQSQQFKIPDDMKITIAKVIALQSLATEPGQQIAMTASAMRWVRVGLVMKYGQWINVPTNYQEIFEHDRQLWQQAMINYGRGSEFWTHALLPCQDIADDMAEIAAVNDMLDYRQVDYNFTVATFGPSAYQIEEEEERARLESQQRSADPSGRTVPNRIRGDSL